MVDNWGLTSPPGLWRCNSAATHSFSAKFALVNGLRPVAPPYSHATEYLDFFCFGLRSAPHLQYWLWPSTTMK